MTNSKQSLSVEDEAREFLAVAHEGAKKPLVALDIRTGNLGRMGVMWVETATALAALEAALRSRSPLEDNSNGTA